MIYWVENYCGLCSGWKVEGHPGVVNNYGAAIALNMGLWEEMCEYYRN